MAIWQFDLHFVHPKGCIPELTEDGAVFDALSAGQCNVARRLLLARVGPPHLMMDAWEVYGTEVGSRFDVLTEEDGRGEVSARVDARANYDAFLQLICDVAAEINCGLHSLEFRAPVEPSLAALRHAISLSRAAAYVRDHSKTLLGNSDA